MYYRRPRSRLYGVKPTTLFRKVLWFENRGRFDNDYFEMLQPRREVSHKPRYKSGVFRSDKCGREIQYESGLELEFIKALERSGEVLFYWEQPVAIPYWRGKLKARTYPDFGIYLRSGHFLLAEVKPLADMLDHRVQRKTEALMEYCSKRGFGMLLTDGRHTPKDLLKGKVNRKLERALLAALAQHPLHQAECREIMERCHATAAELHKAVIRHKFRFRPFPNERGTCGIVCDPASPHSVILLFWSLCFLRFLFLGLCPLLVYDCCAAFLNVFFILPDLLLYNADNLVLALVKCPVEVGNQLHLSVPSGLHISVFPIVRSVLAVVHGLPNISHNR